MPLSLEPNIEYDIYLESDESKPVESRPTFTVKSQTLRGQRVIIRTLDLIIEKELAADKLFSETVATLAAVLSGWRNMNGIGYSPERIEEVLSYSEARELLRKVAFNSRVSDSEKKASA